MVEACTTGCAPALGPASKLPGTAVASPAVTVHANWLLWDDVWGNTHFRALVITSEKLVVFVQLPSQPFAFLWLELAINPKACPVRFVPPPNGRATCLASCCCVLITSNGCVTIAASTPAVAPDANVMKWLEETGGGKSPDTFLAWKIEYNCLYIGAMFSKENQ